jgi:hypothetical protein
VRSNNLSVPPPPPFHPEPYNLSSFPHPHITFIAHRYRTHFPNHLFFFFVYFLGGLDCVCHSFAYAPFCTFERCLRAAVAARRAKNSATHLRACKEMGAKLQIVKGQVFCTFIWTHSWTGGYREKLTPVFLCTVTLPFHHSPIRQLPSIDTQTVPDTKN